MNDLIYDFIGIGFGPANIALAVAESESENKDRLKSLYLEKKQRPNWQEEMLFGNSDIQNHPLRDLVTPRNPRSFFSFVNYLHENKRLFQFLNLGRIFPVRSEYADYVKWVASFFDDIVRYSIEVKSITFKKCGSGGENYYCIETKCKQVFLARSVVLAPGRTPHIPCKFADIRKGAYCHLTKYNSYKKRIKDGDKVCVVGGSQSAVEIILDLNATNKNIEITGIHRNFGFRQKDTSPFTGEVYFPEFVDFFYDRSIEEKRMLQRDLRYTNYSSADSDVLDELYLEIYKQSYSKTKNRIDIVSMAHIGKVYDEKDGRTTIEYTTMGKESRRKRKFDLVILATGFKDMGVNEVCHGLLKGLSSNINQCSSNRIYVNKNYSLDFGVKHPKSNPLFLNGLCENSHGMGDAGSFSLLSLRSQAIFDSIYETYRSEKDGEYKTESNTQQHQAGIERSLL